MPNTVKYAIILFIITAIASASLGLTNEITLPVIEKNKEAAMLKSMAKLLDAESANFVSLDSSSPNIAEIYRAEIGGDTKNIVGYVFSVLTRGYGGEISMLVAIDTEGVIKGIDILTHSETPGLGANADKPSFTSQFGGKHGLLSVTKSTPGGSEVMAITAATITTKAVTNGVNTAIAYYAENWEALSR